MKPAAALTSSLLARKGFAAPSGPLPFQTATPAPAPRAASPLPRDAQPRPAAKKAAPAGGKSRRVALTLRLDPERHLRLRLLAAHQHMSSQDILSAALDQYLADHLCAADLEHCACLQGAANCGRNEGSRG